MSEKTQGKRRHPAAADRKAASADRKEMLRQSLVKIRKLQARLDAAEHEKHAPIAIVGMACRYPGGANDPDAFWRLLENGVDAITDVPPERWRAEDYFDPDPAAAGKAYVMRAGYLDDVESFDAPFFEISPTEARQMDPQQRLLLQVSWEALEHAAIAPDSLSGTATGAFVGMTASDFLLLNLAGSDYDIDTYLASGTSHAVAAGRLAYFLGLQGPAVTVDTACSAALLAVHQACQSLRIGECRTALAGGALLILSPFGHISACKGGMLAPDGRCKTFDKTADGYVRAEGVAMLVLKRLADAEADGDNILAVIRGTASNQDGRSGGLTAPNGRSQEAVIRQALADAGVSEVEIAYVETHGTGTSLGDPIEVQALGNIHAGQRDPDKPLLIGSVKTNIGHTEAVAGVAGLMKVVLALQHRKIPPHLHCHDPNPHIPWGDYPIEVASELTDWPAWTERNIAGLSSFGFSGTNVHMIVEEAPAAGERDVGGEHPYQLMTLSGRSDAAVAELANAYAIKLRDDPAVSVEDVCYTASIGRSHFDFRCAVLATTRDELQSALEAVAAGNEHELVRRGKARLRRQPLLAFAFAGLNSESAAIGRTLYDTQPAFQCAVDECDALLGDRLGRSLTSVLFTPGAEAASPHNAKLMLFAIEWAMVKLWQSWGITPAMAIGEGVGAIVAACVAETVSLEDGLALAAEYGRLLQAQDGTITDAAFAAYADALSRVSCSPPRIELFSAATGDGIGAREISDPVYWRDHVASPGVSESAIGTMLSQGAGAFVQLGRGEPLTEIGRRVSAQSEVPWLLSMEESHDDYGQLLSGLASLYVLGAAVDWQGLYRGRAVRRTHLPTYPFERTRYAMPAQQSADAALTQALNAAPQTDAAKVIGDWFYEVGWRQLGSDGYVDDAGAQSDRSWIVFGDHAGIGDALRDQLAARGASVTLVEAGDEFRSSGERRFVLRPDRPADYKRLVDEALGAGQAPCHGIVHLWSLDAATAGEMTTAQLEKSQSLAVTSAMLLVQALASQKGSHLPRLWLATRGAQAVEMNGRSMAVAQAPLWGLGRTIAAEHAELWGGLVDVDPSCSVRDAAVMLCREVVTAGDEDQVVLRGGVRYVPQLRRRRELAHNHDRLRCRPDRAYLITGGLGGLGVAAARWLVSRGACRLILIGRTPLPDRREWNDVDPNTAVAEKIAAVRELESLGASVHLASVDVADSAELAAFLDEYRMDGWPPVGGVLHAAGTVEYGSLLDHDTDKLTAVMRAKIIGGWSLHRCFEDSDLEFFIMYSSAASVVNSPMLGGYAAANAFLDALAKYREANGLPTSCINWGSWSGIGMATKHDAGDRVATGASALTISPELGYAALERILLARAAQVVVLPMDWQHWSHLYSGLSRSSMFDELIGSATGPAESTPRVASLDGVSEEDRPARVFGFLKETLGALLGLSQQGLDSDKRISQMGFDSLMAVQLKNKLEKELGVVVPMGVLLAGPSIDDLAAKLLDDMSGPAAVVDAEIDSEEGEL